MKKVFLFLTTLISLSALTIDGSAQIDRGELGSLTTVKDGLRSRRISSADKTGNNGTDKLNMVHSVRAVIDHKGL